MTQQYEQSRMVTLRHAVKIAARREAVYRAFTEITEMAGWHIGSVSGKVAVGEVFFLERRPGMRFGWRTDHLEPHAKIVQTYIEGAGSSRGKSLAISLSDLPQGHTLLELSDGTWDEDDPHMPFCNTYWGEALGRLRAYLETGK